MYCIFLFVFIWVRLLSILHDHSLFFIPATSAIDRWLRRISIPDFIQYFFILSLFLRKSPDYPFKCWVLNKGTTGTIFIMSLVWLGIEPGTSRTECQHSTTRLSRRQFVGVWDITFHQPTDWPPDWTTTWNGPTNWLTTWLNDHSKWSNKLTDNLPAQPLEMVGALSTSPITMIQKSSINCLSHKPDYTSIVPYNTIQVSNDTQNIKYIYIRVLLASSPRNTEHGHRNKSWLLYHVT